jgi:arylsulfatase A-like enzyme
LIAGFLKPHPPFHPPPGWAENLYPPDKITLPPIGDVSGYPKHIQNRIKRHQALGEHRLRAARAGYMGNLAFLDVCIGDVLKALDELNLAENTIVVYTSDHGDMDGDHGLWQKFVLYGPSVNVPLIVSYPKSIPAGRVSQALVEYIGLYPTLAELAGISAPPAFAEFALSSAVPQYMIRTARYKYIHNDADIDELYDLDADPDESRNRATDDGLARIRQQLRGQLTDWYDPTKNRYKPRA